MIGDIFQPTHLLFLLVVVLLVLGPKRLPEVARSLGRGMRDFKDAISGQDTAMSTLQKPIPPVGPPGQPPATEQHSAATPESQPVTVAAPTAEPQTQAAPESQPAASPEREPVASQPSKDPGEGNT